MLDIRHKKDENIQCHSSQIMILQFESKKEYFESKVINWKVCYFCDLSHVWVCDSIQTNYDSNHNWFWRKFDFCDTNQLVCGLNQEVLYFKSHTSLIWIWLPGENSPLPSRCCIQILTRMIRIKSHKNFDLRLLTCNSSYTRFFTYIKLQRLENTFLLVQFQ